MSTSTTVGPKYTVIVGPTASGKSARAYKLVDSIRERGLKAEIISCDAVQVYKAFDIGSAKPSAAEQAEYKHHLIDICSWGDSYDAAEYARDSLSTLQKLIDSHIYPIIVGGSGLYLRALWGDRWSSQLPSDPQLREQLFRKSKEDLYQELIDLDPQRAGELHINDKFRVSRAVELCRLTGKKISILNKELHKKSQLQNSLEDSFSFLKQKEVLYLKPEREERREKIKRRCQQMFKNGFVEEVENLLSLGVAADCKPMKSIGYRLVVEYLQNKISRKNLEERFFNETCQYSKRQVTWFNKFLSPERS